MLTPVRTLRSAAFPALFASLLACSSVETESPDTGASEESTASASDDADSSQSSSDLTGAEPGAAKLSPPGQDEQDSLREQRRQAVVQAAMDNARAFVERGDLEAAQTELDRALQFDPGNPEVNVEYLKILALRGERAGEASTVAEAAANRMAAKREAMRLEAEESHRLGQRARERGDYDEAIRNFERVRDSIQWSSLEVAWGDLPERNGEALSAARIERENAMAAAREEQIQRAFDAIRDEEAAETQRMRDQVANLLESGAMKFERGDFDAAIDLADEALFKDPNNAIAIDLRERSIEERRKGRADDYREQREQVYRTLMLQIEELRVPYSEALTPANREYWQMVERRSSVGEANIEVSAEDQRIRELVANARIDEFSAEDEELGTVAGTLQALTGVTIVVTPEGLEEADAGAGLVTLPLLRNLPLSSLLDIITRNLSEEMAWTVADGVVKLTTKEKAFGDPIIRVHGVQDLTFPLTNFKGPELDRIALPGEYGDEPETSVFAADIEGEAILELSNIIELIQQNVARESWETGSDRFSITEASGNQILVIHTPEIQAEIAQFLDDLRSFSSTFVRVESRFVEITDAFIQEIGADLRGLSGAGIGSDVVLDDTVGAIAGSPAATEGMDNFGTGTSTTADPSAGIFFNDGSDGDIRARNENFFASSLGEVLSTVGGGAFQFALLDDTEVNLVLNAVEKSANATEVMAPTLTVYNTERAYMTVVNQISFLQDFDVDVANTAFIANPDIGILQEGVVLDVRPAISYDRKYITLDVRTTIADLERPIPTFETTLAGFTDSVTFELPRMRIENAQTTVRVPDGGSVVLGGLKTIRHINRKATVPWLGNIPVLGFFFREKGVVDETTSLVIVVRAHIMDLSSYRDKLPLR